MTTASNRLYRGELDGDPIGALQAIVDELEYEAAQAGRTVMGVPPNESDFDYAKRFRADAEKVRETKSYVNAAVRKALSGVYEQLAQEIRDQKMAGDMSDVIADALVDGCWETCAI